MGHFGRIWNRKDLIFKGLGIGLVLAIFLALFSGREYTSETVLMPEYMEGQNQRTQLFTSVLGGAGIQTYRGTTDAVRVDHYPSIARSVPIMLQVMETEYFIESYDVNTDLYTFWKEIYRPSVATYVYSYTIGLPFTVLGWVRSWFAQEEDEDILYIRQEVDVMDDGLFELSRQRHRILQNTRDRIAVTINMDDYTITVSSTFPDARLAAAVNRRVVQLLTDYVIDYRIRKLSDDLQFIEERLEDAGQRFRKAQIELAGFRDQNVQITSARAAIQGDRLREEYEMAFDLYSTLTRDREERRFRLQEETPLFKTLEPTNVPIYPSSPNFLMIFILWPGLGFLFGVGLAWIYGKGDRGKVIGERAKEFV